LHPAEKLLTTATKDIRVATYYAWARLCREGESGLADGLELLADAALWRTTSSAARAQPSGRAGMAASTRMLDSLSRYPEVNNAETLRIAGALLLAERAAEGAIPGSLYQALEIRLQQSGGPDAVVPQNVSGESHTSPAMTGSVPSLTGIASGQELLAQARVLAEYLRNQPDGWLSAHRLIKNLRHDTLRQLPPLSADGKPVLSRRSRTSARC
jgi:type VI secretion system protein VasJ